MKKFAKKLSLFVLLLLLTGLLVRCGLTCRFFFTGSFVRSFLAWLIYDFSLRIVFVKSE